MRTFSSLLVVTFIGIRMACRIGYRTTSTLICIAVIELCHSTGGSYICLSSESIGPNLLDEPLKGFIVNPALVVGQEGGRLGRKGKSRLIVKVYNLYRV